MASVLLLVGGQKSEAQELRNLNNQFKTELGCPVEVVKATTTLEIDPIGAPMACRIYLDYRNVSTKSITGVKFRIGYIDSEEKVRGTFHAPDGHPLEPGGTASAKWRGEKIDPRTASVLIRVLVARYADGSIWESAKMKELAPGTGGDGHPAGGSASPSSFAAPEAAPAAPQEAAPVSAGYSRAAAAQEQSRAASGSNSASTGNPSSAPASQAGDSFDSFEGSASPPAGSSGAAANPPASSSSTSPAATEAPATAAPSASPAAEKAGSDKSTDGY